MKTSNERTAGNPMENMVNTRQAALLLGVGPTTIKRWADQGLLQHSKTAGGHRRFRRRDIAAFDAENQGVASSISTLSGTSDVKAWVDLLCVKRDTATLTAALLEARGRTGSWHRLAGELGSVLTAIGLMWQNAQLSIFEEQTASQGLRRALHACLQLFPTPGASLPTCLIAPVEGDFHMFGVLLCELCAREAGWQVVSAAGPLPLGELAAWASLLERVDVIAVSASSHSNNTALLVQQCITLRSIAAQSGATLVLGGSGAWPETTTSQEVRINDFSALSQLFHDLGDS